MPLSSAKKLGPYEIISPLGAGGMGEVYRARDTRLKRDVAIKVLPEHLAKDHEALNRFEREAQAVAALSHPNILAVYDVGTEQAVSFVVMELLEGETLRERVRRSAVPWREAIEYGVAIADGLAAAHAKGIIHRDLKPENIFLTKDGVVKILDFGLARIVPAVGKSLPPVQLDTPTVTLDTRPGTVLGTVNYMSPEQVRGHPTDARSDIFSFGCVLYEMVTGHRPFSGDTAADMITGILKEEPADIADSGFGVPPELEQAIRHCLEKKPEDRFQSARDLAFSLKTVLSTSRVSVPSRVLERPRRGPAFWILAACLSTVALSALLVALNVGGWRARLFARVTPGSIQSLAVLPLENLSGDPEQEYFADGMTDALITNLSKIAALRVISRTSAMRYRGTDKSLPEIARELNVDAVVEGSVLRVGNRVRITAQLIEAATDRHLWADSYERDLRDILAMQSEIARAIADEIRIKLIPQEDVQLASTRPVNPDAYEAYLLGEHYRRNWNTLGREKALEYFEQAIAKDPAYAPAYAGLASSYTFLGFFGHLPREDAFPKARQLAVQALALDDTLADAHRILGLNAFYYDWDWVEAERSFRRAIELSPSDARPHIVYAWYLLAMRRFDEGIAEAQRARELDPLSLTANLAYGQALYMARRFDDAMLQFRACVDLEPNDPWAHTYLAKLHERKGQFDLAALEHQKDMRYSGRELEEIAAYSQAYTAGGWEVALKWTIDNLEAKAGREHRPAPSLSLAAAYAKLGEQDKAFEWLEKAYERRNSSLPYLAVNPDFDPLRDDPRFNDLLRRIGLKPTRAAGFSPRDRTTGDSFAPDGKIMLAVLPFENMSPEPQEWFSDGMTEEMIAQLGRLHPKKLGVIARTSAMRYKNTTKGIDQIGRELRVQYILEGSVRRAGERVRITAQLVQVSDQTHLWAQSYNRHVADVFAIQIDVAEQIARALALELLPGEQAALAQALTTSPAAHEAYLRGRYYWNKRTPEALKKAVEYFQRAVEQDPGYALAYAGVADSYAVMASWNLLPPDEGYPKAKAAARKALEIDDTLAEAHATLAAIAKEYDWNFSGAERGFKKALQLNPGYATAHQWYAEYLAAMGRHEEAIAEIERAEELDPLSLIINAIAGYVCYFASEYDQAIDHCQKALELDPNFATAHYFIGWVYERKGMYGEAIAELQKARTLSGNIDFLAVLGHAYAVSGRTKQARKILDEVKAFSERAYVSPYVLALIYMGLGEKDQAFAWLETAFTERAINLVVLKVDPRYDGLRDDPRFNDLLRRIGLKPAPRNGTNPLGERPE